MTLLRALPALALLAAFALPAPAAAYVRSRVPGDGPCLWWGTRELQMKVHRDGSADVTDGSDFAAVAASAQAWTEPACSDVLLSATDKTTATEVGYAGAGDPLLIIWRERDCEDVVPEGDRCWDCLDEDVPCCGATYGCWEHAGGIIGLTTTTFQRSSGQIVDADIELNGAHFLFTTADAPGCAPSPTRPVACVDDRGCLAGQACLHGECLQADCVRFDIANTVTHEMGHVIGLDHPPEVGRETTMYASAPQGEIKKRTLEGDDVQGLCDIYPIDGPTLTCLGDGVGLEPLDSTDQVGCGGCGAGGAAGPVALLLAALGLVRRRR